MLKLFKKAFWIVCEDITACPSISETHAAIAKHCESNGYSYHFIGDNEIEIEGRREGWGLGFSWQGK